MSQISQLIGIFKRKVERVEFELLKQQAKCNDLIVEIEQCEADAQDYSDAHKNYETEQLGQMIAQKTHAIELANLPIKISKIRDYEKNLYLNINDLIQQRTGLENVINGLILDKKALLKKIELHTILLDKEQQNHKNLMEAKEDSQIDDFSIFQHFSK